jgi:hypothetical protein
MTAPATVAWSGSMMWLTTRTHKVVVDLVEAHDRAAAVDDLEDDVGRGDVTGYRGRVERGLQRVEAGKFQMQRVPPVIVGLFGSGLLQEGGDGHRDDAAVEVAGALRDLRPVQAREARLVGTDPEAGNLAREDAQLAGPSDRLVATGCT